MDSLKKIKAEKIYLTLTLGEVDALVFLGTAECRAGRGTPELFAALGKLDEAVNV